MRDGVGRKEPEDVGEGVDVAERGNAPGIAQSLLGDGRHVDVLHGGVGDLGRLKEFAERFQARVGDAGDAGAGGCGADAGLYGYAGKDREE